jgi:mycothiol synthase
VGAVRALAADVARADGVAALSEGFDLALPALGHHVVAEDAGAILGYAGVAPDGAAELLVHPDHRRAGLGSRLARVATSLGAQRFWAHGDLDGARGFARAAGADAVRSLHRMSRPLTTADTVDPILPKGCSARAFIPGVDDAAWVTLNAAALAHHPEQGRLTLADLRERIAQPWFDPEGFFLVTDDAAPETGPIAFHWTKVDPGGPPGEAREGEVYVVGVHPAYQGRGLARPLTRLGTAPLARRGLATVVLYVDGDIEAALATYAKEGFAIASTDVMYAVPSFTP